MNNEYKSNPQMNNGFEKQAYFNNANANVKFDKYNNSYATNGVNGKNHYYQSYRNNNDKNRNYQQQSYIHGVSQNQTSYMQPAVSYYVSVLPSRAPYISNPFLYIVKPCDASSRGWINDTVGSFIITIHFFIGVLRY